MEGPIQAKQFDDEWRRWIAENLVLGGTRESIVATLVASGFDPRASRDEVERADKSPYLIGTKRLSNRLRKREWVLEIHRRLNRALPNGDRVEIRERLSRDAFLREYYTTNRPVVIRNMFEDWPARRSWSPAYLKQKYGDRVVEVQAGRDRNPRYEIESSQHRRQMTLGAYVDLITSVQATNDVYITANNTSHNATVLRELWSDITQIPEYLDGNSPQKGFFWFGPAGTITPLHHDLTNNFMAQVYGRKLVKLIPSCDLPYVYNDQHCYSQVDMGAIDETRFPDMRHARVIDCMIEPGDLLFLPVGWWHYVKGLDISITVTFTNFLFNNDFHSFYSTYREV